MNHDVLEQISRRYELSFIAHYREPMSRLKGTAVFTNDTLHYFNFDNETNSAEEQERLDEIMVLQDALLGRNGLQR